MHRITAISASLVALSLFSGCKKDKEPSAESVSSAPIPTSRTSESAVSSKAPKKTGSLAPAKVLFSSQDRPIAVRVHGDHVYWINAGTGPDERLARGKGEVVRGPKSGGEATVLVRGQNLPDGLRVDGQWIYWTSEYDVFKAPTSGGEPSYVFEGNENLGSPMALVVRDDRIVFGLSHPETGGLQVLDKAGKPVREPFAVSGGVSVATISGDSVFAYSRRQLAIGRMPIEQGAPKTMVADVKGCGAMVTDDVKVYWTEPGDARIRAIAVAGGEPQTLSEGYEKPWALAWEGEMLMMADREAGTIVTVPKKGGRGTIVAEDQGTPMAVDADAGFIYWTSPDRGTISRVEQPRR